jgi:hypothetical protein
VAGHNFDLLPIGHFEDGCRFGAHVGASIMIACRQQFLALLLAQQHYSSSHRRFSSSEVLSVLEILP